MSPEGRVGIIRDEPERQRALETSISLKVCWKQMGLTQWATSSIREGCALLWPEFCPVVLNVAAMFQCVSQSPCVET